MIHTISLNISTSSQENDFFFYNFPYCNLIKFWPWRLRPHCIICPFHTCKSCQIQLHFHSLFFKIRGPGGSMNYVVGLPNNSYKPITNTAWVHTRLCKLQKRVHSTLKFTSCLPMVSGSPASSTTKTGRHDIAESGVKHNKSNKIIF